MFFFHFSCFAATKLARKSVWKQQSSFSAPVSQSMVGVVISQILPVLSFLNCLNILDWNAPIRTQTGVVLTNERREIPWSPSVDATCAGRILSNTSSRRPLGSQGWGWEKFPLGGVFTKPGVMPHPPRLFLRVRIFEESVENKNQIPVFSVAFPYPIIVFKVPVTWLYNGHPCLIV